MDKRIYDAIRYKKECVDEISLHHINELILVCEEYVKEINRYYDEHKQLEKDIEFFKKRQEINKIVTQELVALNDKRIEDILTKTRII
jgi:UTP-glucose-1-phosphate uridylyltransferase